MWQLAALISTMRSAYVAAFVAMRGHRVATVSQEKLRLKALRKRLLLHWRLACPPPTQVARSIAEHGARAQRAIVPQQTCILRAGRADFLGASCGWRSTSSPVSNH